MQGEAGMGKSSLIFEFLRQHALPAVTASGDATEAVLPYGVVRQLAVSAAATVPGALDGLALLCAGPRADADPLAVGVELLALISSVQGEHAAAVVVEDLQWADLPSARALLFACRRLAADRVIVVLTCRPDEMWQLGEGWSRFLHADSRTSMVTLGGLSVDEIGQLCRRLGRAEISGRAVRRLAELTGGNPLYARAMLAELSDESLQTASASLPAPRLLAGLILPRLAALPQPARDLVVAASVLGDQCTLADAAAVARVDDPAAALEVATRAGLLTDRGGQRGWAVGFPHLLIRRAIYDDLGADRRRQLHRRAAAALGAQDGLPHRVAAADSPDPKLVSDLRSAAVAAVSTGKLPVAARYLQQAAEINERGPDRDSDLLSAFELLVRAADVASAEAARPAVEQLTPSARRDSALGHLALLAARPWEADALLRAAWARHGDSSDSGRGEAALGLGQLLGITGSFSEACLWLDRALASGSGGEDWYDAARCIRSYAYALGGDSEAALGLFRDLPEPAAQVPASRTDALTYRGIARLCAGDVEAGAHDLGLAVHRVRTGAQVRFPGPPLAFLTEAEFRLGRWDDAQGHGDLAVALARDADRDYDLAFVHSVAAPVAACRGDWQAASAHADSAERAARSFGGMAAVFAASARAMLGFSRQDPREALRGAALAQSLPEIDRYECPALLWWRPAQVWALILTGEVDAAQSVLGAFAARATAQGEHGSLIDAARLRGMLSVARGDFRDADVVLQAGRLAARRALLPFHCALLDLEHARCLAHLQRRGSAVAAARAALDAFAALGAVPFLRAAEAELTGLGLRPRSGDDPDLPGLTAQELRVARLVASGLSNPEAAAELYLSPKTIEYHLANAFAKLGVHSRHQLAALIRGRASPGGQTPGKP